MMISLNEGATLCQSYATIEYYLSYEFDII